MMSRKYSHQLLRIAVAQICQNLGWNSAQSSSLEVLTDVLEKYLLQLSVASHRYCEHAGRTQPNLDDLGLAFQQMGIEISELEDYVRHVDPVPFAHEVVAFPAPKASNLNFPSSRSREIMQHRKEHVPSHLPCMFPNMRDEIPEDIAPVPAVSEDSEEPEALLKVEPIENGEAEESNVGEKRPAPASTPEMPPSKRPRFGNSNLPEEAGHSKYEMTCVFIGPNGVLTTRQGVQGRLPEPCLPPPNPRTVSEGSNKENSGKTKDGGSNGISVGGIGTNGISSHKSEGKKSKKSLNKKSGKFSETSSSKKSASSKAAAKFLKKLKLNKKSAKLFGHSKLKDLKIPEHLKDSSPEKIKSYLIQASLEQNRKKKEKKSAPLDSDEEIRNLSSPASREASPEGEADKEVGENKKARMEAIDDSINAVLKEETNKGSKAKKKKKSLDKSGGEEGKDGDKKKATSGKKSDEKVKRKPGRPPKVQKTPEAAPAVDLKPFVSDRYSQDELQVYEFNDSPPDASVKARRPSAADADKPTASAAASASTPKASMSKKEVKKSSTPSGRPPAKHSSSGHRLHKKGRKAVVEDDLFAPEIKLESKSNKDNKQKSKGRPEVKEKDKKEKHKLDREKSLEKDKNTEKDNRKDKKDKKKEKEKKKKHKEKDHVKEKEKTREDKTKEEHRDSRDSSPSVGASGVKLKIKLGGSAGSSMMVTGDSNSSVASSPTNRMARESMSPPRTVPKLYISRKGQEEKGKKTTKGVKRNESKKSKGSPLAVSNKSRSVSPTSNKTSPSPRSTPTPPVPHDTITSSSSKSISKKLLPKKTVGKKKKFPISSTPASERKSRAPVKEKSMPKDKKKKERQSLSSQSSSSSNSSVSPAKRSKKRKSPARAGRMSSSSPSPERSPPPLPFQGSAPSPPPVKPSGDRSTSRNSSSQRSPTPRKSSPSRSVSPHHRRQGSMPRSPSPSKPPTPGSTSPAPSPDWNLPDSSAHHDRSPSPAPSPTQQAPPSPKTHWPPASSPDPHRSPSPASRPPSRQVAGTPEPRSMDIPSPTSSGKSSSSASKQTRGVEAETVCVFINDSGQQVWICPGCKKPDDGSEMIGCDMCDNWYHWPCVGITEAPPEEQQWFCPKCLPKTKATTSSRGRGRPRGRGRGRGRKKIT